MPKNPSVTDDAEETHELSFRGLWMPEVIIRSFLDEKINASEAMLLAIIDGFSKNGKCWASNAYLAKRMNLDERHLRRMLASLCRLKLLEKITSAGGQRFLRTICGINQVGAENQKQSTDAPRTSTPSRTDAPRTLAPGGEGANAHQDIKTRDKGKISVPSFDSERKSSSEENLAVLLKNGLSFARKLTAKVDIQKWAAEFRKFLAASENKPADVSATISWYVKNIDGEFMPQAFSAESFCRKYPAIEAAKARSQKNDAPEGLTKFEVTDRITEAAVQIQARRRNIDPKISKNLGVLLAGLEQFFKHAKRVSQDYSKEHATDSRRRASGEVLSRRICTGLSAASEFAEMLLAGRAKASDFDPEGEKMAGFIESWQLADGAPPSHTTELLGEIWSTWGN